MWYEVLAVAFFGLAAGVCSFYLLRRRCLAISTFFGRSRVTGALAAVLVVVPTAFVLALFSEKGGFNEYSDVLAIIFVFSIGIVCCVSRTLRTRLALGTVGWCLTTILAAVLGAFFGLVLDAVRGPPGGMFPLPNWLTLGAVAGLAGAIAGLGVGIWLATIRQMRVQKQSVNQTG